LRAVPCRDNAPGSKSDFYFGEGKGPSLPSAAKWGRGNVLREAIQATLQGNIADARPPRGQRVPRV
jgi:hypothetical protein